MADRESNYCFSWKHVCDRTKYNFIIFSDFQTEIPNLNRATQKCVSSIIYINAIQIYVFFLLHFDGWKKNSKSVAPSRIAYFERSYKTFHALGLIYKIEVHSRYIELIIFLCAKQVIRHTLNQFRMNAGVSVCAHHQDSIGALQLSKYERNSVCSVFPQSNRIRGVFNQIPWTRFAMLRASVSSCVTHITTYFHIRAMIWTRRIRACFLVRLNSKKLVVSMRRQIQNIKS